ncbi:MAG: hypothetical protein ABW003_01595 [Microvirga sp.]
MVLLILAAILGGTGAFGALLPYGWLVALIGFPFGGSLAASLAAVYLSLPSPARVAVRGHRAFPGGSALGSPEH